MCTPCAAEPCPLPCPTCSIPRAWLDLRATPGSYATYRSPPPRLSPAWALLLFGDCSPTRVIGLLSGSPLTISLLGMEPLGACCDGVPYPAAVASIPAPRVRRRVWLEAGGSRVGYAVSWWSEGSLATFLPSFGAPIGDALGASRLEVHRELLGVAAACGHGALEEGLGKREGGGGGGELWGRWYLMWHKGHPVCMIHEVFSPGLDKWLGAPQQENQAL